MAITEDMLTHRDMFIIRRCVVMELGSFNKAALWSRIEFRAHKENRDAVFADGYWWWRVTQEDMAEDLGLSTRTVRSLLGALEGDGLIEVAEHSTDSYDHTKSYRCVVAGRNGQFDAEEIAESDAAEIAGSSLSLYEVDIVRNPKVSDAGDKHVDQLFDDWYQDYPRKDAKGQARRAFKAALKKTDMDTLCHGRDLYVAKIKQDGTERKYIKLPSSWLNGECWDDDYGDVKIVPSGFEGWFESMLADANTAEVERILGLVFPMPDEVPPGVDRQEFLAECRRSWLGDVKPQALSRWVVQFGDARNGP